MTAGRTNLGAIRLDGDLRDRRITADYVADALREAIHSGGLADDAVLNQAAIASHFGVSRVPVREAMRQLQAEGLIESRAHRLAVVRGLKLERLVEIYALRALLEGWVLEQAVPMIDAKRLARARAINDTLCGEPDHARWLQGNARFHRTLNEPSGAEATLELLDQLRARAERYTRLWSRGSGIHRADEASREHEAIVALVEAGDGAGARAALERHISHTRDRVITYAAAVLAAGEEKS